MDNNNRVSVTIADQTVTDILGHIAAIEALLPFLLTRDAGDNSVMLGEKSVGFDEKCAGYMTSNPEFIPGYIALPEVLKDRTARAQFLKFLPSLNLLTAKAEDTFDVIGEAANHGAPGAGTIHDDLATRYPGRPAKATSAKAAQTAVK